MEISVSNERVRLYGGGAMGMGGVKKRGSGGGMEQVDVSLTQCPPFPALLDRPLGNNWKSFAALSRLLEGPRTSDVGAASTSQGLPGRFPVFWGVLEGSSGSAMAGRRCG